MTNSSQKHFWDQKWQKGEYRPASNFAKRSWEYLRNKNYKTLLDLGCGNGNDAIYFSKKGLGVTAVDISSTALSQFRARKNISNITILEQDVTNLSLEDQSFDVIYANLSLHYFDDKTTKNIFDKLYKLLRPSGTILIKCKSVNDSRNGQTERFYNFFTKQSMQNYMKQFKIIRIRQTSSVYNEYRSNFNEAIATKSQ